MPNNIDDKELERLEELAGKASKGPYKNDGDDGVLADGELIAVCTLGDEEYIAAACNAVPALVAEVRRLREKVSAWEWMEEVRSCKPWNDHPYWEACGNSSKRGKIFDSAVDEYKLIYKAAREAVHADRE